MGASPGGTRHWISRDLIFQFMLSNARPVGHKVSIIYVLIMDEPPLLLLQKALHLTLLQADDAAGPLSAQLLPDGYLVPPELRRLREHFVTRLWFQTLEASPFWAQLYLGMLVLRLCQPWGWSGEKSAPETEFSTSLPQLLLTYWPTIEDAREYYFSGWQKSIQTTGPHIWISRSGLIQMPSCQAAEWRTLKLSPFMAAFISTRTLLPLTKLIWKSRLLARS